MVRLPLHLIEGMGDYQYDGAKLSLDQINFGKNVVIPKMAWKEVQDMMVNPENVNLYLFSEYKMVVSLAKKIIKKNKTTKKRSKK